MRLPILPLLAALAVALPACSEKPPVTLTEPAVTVAQPTATLTLADFTNVKGEPPAEGWVSEADGTIHLVGKGPGNLVSKAEYTNFELEWEWKVCEGGNNGIKYWVNNHSKTEKPNWLGVEYQMIDDVRHEDAAKGNHDTASIYDIKGAAKDKAVKPAGEWNTSKIVVKDGKIEHWLNGKLAVTADTSNEEWKAGVAASKFKAVEGFAPGKGRLMLTEHGNETWFKNIRVKAL